MPDEPPVGVVDGPKGQAQIFEVWEQGRLVDYQVRVNDENFSCTNLGEAYILAGEKVGKPT